MYKKIIYRLLAIFLFVFISVTFLIPSDLKAETQKFWVKDGHYEDQDFWVTSGFFKDTQEKRWVDTSHMVESGYWETKKEWVDTSHMVYQGYWKNVSKSFWVDTRQWVSGGYWKYVTERVWVKSGYTAYRDVKKWVDTSHWTWVNSGYWNRQWVNTSHWETRYRTVRQAYSVWVSSGYWNRQWVNTSHWETRYRNVRQSYRVYVSSGYWQRYWAGYRWRVRWINTSHWETRYRNVSQAYSVWVSSGYWKNRWINTSHWETRYRNVSQAYSVWVSSGYWKNVWVDTSHWTWVNSGYWKTEKEAYWADTSHWENQKVKVGGYWYTRYREVEDWQPCNKTFVDRPHGGEGPTWFLAPIRRTEEDGNNPYKGTINGNTYKFNIFYVYKYGGETIVEFFICTLFEIKYVCYEVLNWKKVAYSVWVPPDYKKEWVDTSHMVESGYWKSFSYRTWVDTSYLKSEGHWETKKEWVDTSHMVESGYWENYTKRTWVDTSHSETRKVWVDTSHWVEAELDPEGKVLHTEQWNINRINYNTLKTGDPEKPRGYEIFFNGERFVLEADTPGDFQPESVHVEFLGTKFETDLTKTGDIKWEGYIWDESFIYFHDRDCVFKFTASYDYNGEKFKIEDEVAVYIVRDYYWQLHRLF